jgi:hypothetical protein
LYSNFGFNLRKLVIGGWQGISNLNFKNTVIKGCGSGLDLCLIGFWFSWGKWRGLFMGMTIDWVVIVLLGVCVV